MARRPTHIEARDLRADLVTIRSEIETEQAKVAQIESAPVSPNEVEVRVDRRLDAAERAISEFARFESLVGPVGNPMDDLGLAFAGKQNPLATAVIWLGRPSVRSRLLALANAEYESRGKPMSLDEREAALAATVARMNELSRQEEALARELERQGGHVERRAYADPRWLLAFDEDLEEAVS
ncbi:hypothetical protein [Methylopila sp. Yamaguchi]|uniref:hypothetical protein n=1 Tax=Methylopila sp. Yamaguchi TaxID=1437817 RepID=UPI000CBDB778|nr:hypothetical protein [Methylopila sp. Yamaguchi]GBD50248.1 hypothetical protein METY_3461 [Methylopila sp. Yamaguchi]